MTDREENEVWLDKETADEIKKIEKYLKEHKVVASRTEIVNAAIILARRLGAGDWTFACHFNLRDKPRDKI